MINFSSWSRGTISDETPHAVLMQFIRMEEDRLCKEAQDEVWWEIHRRYSKQIEDHFISLGVSRWDVASLVGELFNRMRTSPPPSDDEVYFRYWCRRVAKQVLIKHWRSLKKTELHVPWPGDQLEDDDKRLHDMAPFTVAGPEEAFLQMESYDEFLKKVKATLANVLSVGSDECKSTERICECLKDWFRSPFFTPVELQERLRVQKMKRKALAHLCVTLIIIGGFTQSEVVDLLDVNKNFVRRYVRLAIRGLRQELRPAVKARRQ